MADGMKRGVLIDLCMIKVTPRGVLGPVTGLPGPCHCYIGGAKINKENFVIHLNFIYSTLFLIVSLVATLPSLAL